MSTTLTLPFQKGRRMSVHSPKSQQLYLRQTGIKTGLCLGALTINTIIYFGLFISRICERSRSNYPKKDILRSAL